jgi:HSP20 family protein
MAQAATKLPIKTEEKEAGAPAPRREWEPFDELRREIDRLFENFHDKGWLAPFRRSLFDVEPFWRQGKNWGALPAVDVADKGTAYEVTAELPGMEEKDIEVKVAEGMLTITGEKKETKEEKKKDYFLSERRYGSFQRSFALPEGVDQEKIEAAFTKGVLTVTLPKKPESVKKERKIAVAAK